MLVLEDVTVTHPGQPAPYVFSMEAAPAQVTAVRGPSGSGKSTLLDLIAGFLIPASGSIRLDGKDLVPLKPEQRPVSILFQSETLFEHLSAARNVALGLPPGTKDAETRNNFEDQDGCPDELPVEVKKFTGVIRGIQFASGNAKIRKSSFPLLDDAVSVLKQYSTLRIRISGHTDSRGKLAKNQKLSEDRANAVKDYLVSRGVESSRVETRGVGPDEPIADNKTAAGRTQNRRIEFELLPQ